MASSPVFGRVKMDGSNVNTRDNNVETVTYRVFHIIFRDIYNNDHHCQVVSLNINEALQKVEGLLSKKKAVWETIMVMPEDDFKTHYRSTLKPFYIIFQNGTKRYCCILATNDLEAKTKFSERFPSIESYLIFDKPNFNALLKNGKWKTIHLSQKND